MSSLPAAAAVDQRRAGAELGAVAVHVEQCPWRGSPAGSQLILSMIAKENCDVQPELKMYSFFIEEEVREPVIDLEWDNPVVEPLTTLSPCLAEELLQFSVEDKYGQEEEVVGEEEEEVKIENIDKPESVEEEEAGEESVPGSPVSDGSSNLSLRESPVSRPNLVLRPDLTAGLPGRVPGSPVSDGSSNLLHVMSFAETTTLQLLVSRVSWSG